MTREEALKEIKRQWHSLIEKKQLAHAMKLYFEKYVTPGTTFNDALDIEVMQAKPDPHDFESCLKRVFSGDLDIKEVSSDAELKKSH